MRFIDASGPIYEGMWSYGQPFPDFKIRELEYCPQAIDNKKYRQYNINHPHEYNIKKIYNNF